MLIKSWLILLLGYTIDLMLACRKDAKEIGVCLHTYLERDFLSIEMVVYPKRNDGNRTLLLEGPKLENDCHHLRQVVDCFTRVLKGCEYMEDFFEYRELISSLEKTHDWLCHDINVIRSRFLVLLTKLHCMQNVWKRSCQVAGIAPNVWNAILRLEENSTVCKQLQEQRTCLVNEGHISVQCGDKAHQLYAEVSNVFFTSWCSTGDRNNAPTLIFLLIFLAIFCR